MKKINIVMTTKNTIPNEFMGSITIDIMIL